MNVTCTSCSAKYAVPDEKVRGKKVRITCKHCGTGIIVDGTRLDSAVAAPEAPASAPASKWDVAFPDEHQETLDAEEIAARYARGALDDEAFLWREGMVDWAAPWDVPEVAAALSARGLTRRPAAAGSAASAPRPTVDDDDEATRVGPSPFDDATANDPFAALPEASKPASGASEPRPAAVPAIAKEAEPAPKAAARKTASRGASGDLFGGFSNAGSEQDESLGGERGESGAPKLTGARNESSVLFSLDALIKNEQQPAPKREPKKQDDAAVLLGGGDAPNSLANVGTGSFGANAFSSALAAPDFNAPIQAPPPESRRLDANESGEPRKKGVGLYVALAVLVLGGGAAAAAFSGKLGGEKAPVASAEPAKPEPKATETAPAAESPKPAETESAAAATASASGAASAAAATPSATAPAPAETTAAAATAPSPAAAAAPGSKPAEAKPAETKPAEAKPAEAKPAAGGGDAPFDKAAAVAALTAAASSAQSCKTADGPTGSGKVTITFMPSGRATNTQVSGDLAGTAVGGCVARIFRGAKVPPFSGDAVTVGKSFSIN